MGSLLGHVAYQIAVSFPSPLGRVRRHNSIRLCKCANGGMNVSPTRIVLNESKPGTMVSHNLHKTVFYPSLLPIVIFPRLLNQPPPHARLFYIAVMHPYPDNGILPSRTMTKVMSKWRIRKRIRMRISGKKFQLVKLRLRRQQPCLK